MIPKEAIEATAGKILEAIISCSHEICADHVKLEYSHKQAGHNAYNQLHRRVTSALTAAFAAMSEPVAWVSQNTLSILADGHEGAFKEAISNKPFSRFSTPLYAAPQPSPDLAAENERLRAALEKLVKSANEVNRLGASTGPQWLKMTAAIVSAKAELERT